VRRAGGNPAGENPARENPARVRPVGPGGAEPVLDVAGLGVRSGPVDLVRDVSFSLGRGERVGLIGESGSGKSLTALALLGLLPEGLRASGSARVADVPYDLVGASERRLAPVRGRRLSMVFQEPMTALNPVMRVGAQVAEVMLVHGTAAGRRQAYARAATLLEKVRLPSPRAALAAYPHQLSGGQRQRVVLAMALANDPAVLVCDEPTTALDVTVQAQVLDLVVRGVAERDSALLFITHDLAVVATVCERVLVMYGGRVVEAGPVAEVFRAPRHRYTQGLLAASDLEAVDARGRLPTIAGTVPGAGHFPDGCVFRTRCAWAQDDCRGEVPPWVGGTAGRGHACRHPAGAA